jgi:phosphoribosylaminoimidazole carboxylase (NCAIR synthetase)
VQNSLDIEHLAKAIKRYDVLTFMKDIVDEMNIKKFEAQDLASVSSMISNLDCIEERTSKRKQVGKNNEVHDVETEGGDEEMTAASKKQKSSQMSITSFFKSN